VQESYTSIIVDEYKKLCASMLIQITIVFIAIGTQGGQIFGHALKKLSLCTYPSLECYI